MRRIRSKPLHPAPEMTGNSAIVNVIASTRMAFSILKTLQTDQISIDLSTTPDPFST